MKYIPELPSCGHMGADFPRIYTSHGHSWKTAQCAFCHGDFMQMLAVIEPIADIRIADFAHKVASACGSIQLGARTTMLVLRALADIADKGDFQSGWPAWCDSSFSEVAVAAALTLPTDDALVKLAKEATGRRFVFPPYLAFLLPPRSSSRRRWMMPAGPSCKERGGHRSCS